MKLKKVTVRNNGANYCPVSNNGVNLPSTIIYFDATIKDEYIHRLIDRPGMIEFVSDIEVIEATNVVIDNSDTMYFRTENGMLKPKSSIISY